MQKMSKKGNMVVNLKDGIKTMELRSAIVEFQKI